MRLLTTLSLCCVCAAPSWAADKALAPDAKQHMEKGLRFFDVQSYLEAIEEFKAGYAVDPAPDFLYAMAQAQRLSGDCFHAVLTYQSFLRTKPPERRAAPARQNIERCQKEEAGGPAAKGPEPTPVPPPPEPAQEARPEPTLIAPAPPPAPRASVQPEPAPPAHPAPPAAIEAPIATVSTHAWYDDYLGDGLMIGGVAAGATGLALIKVGGDGVNKANATLQSTPIQYGDAATAIQQGQSAYNEQVAGVVVASVGGALLAGGLLHVLFHDPGSAAMGCSPLSTGGFSLVAAGHF